ncbi:hypothetical protein FOZ63_032796, partial [Perkinsus olseni]
MKLLLLQLAIEYCDAVGELAGSPSDHAPPTDLDPPFNSLQPPSGFDPSSDACLPFDDIPLPPQPDSELPSDTGLLPDWLPPPPPDSELSSDAGLLPDWLPPPPPDSELSSDA